MYNLRYYYTIATFLIWQNKAVIKEKKDPKSPAQQGHNSKIKAKTMLEKNQSKSSNNLFPLPMLLSSHSLCLLPTLHLLYFRYFAFTPCSTWCCFSHCS